MMQVNVELAIYSAIPLTVITVLSSVLGTRMRNKFREAQEAFALMSDYVTENLSGISVIKAFVKEKIFLRESSVAYYIYRQIKGSDTYIGIIALVATAGVSQLLQWHLQQRLAIVNRGGFNQLLAAGCGYRRCRGAIGFINQHLIA